MRDEVIEQTYNFVIVTLDRHAAGPAARIGPKLALDYPGLKLSIHAAAEWEKDPDALQAAKDDIADADIIVNCVLFLEDHIKAILPDLIARRDACDAMVGVV
jgi:magnesium chelatase subunit H